MLVLGIYAWFALATAICSIYELLYPVLMAQDKIDNKLATIFAFFFISLLVAPIAFIACIVPSVGVTFRIYLTEGLFPKAA